MSLTPQFEAVLANIYDQVDLDGNGTLSRTEFNLFNWRTSGEEVQDDEWQVVRDNFAMKNGELTMEGFLQLHQVNTKSKFVALGMDATCTLSIFPCLRRGSLKSRLHFNIYLTLSDGGAEARLCPHFKICLALSDGGGGQRR